VLAAQMLSIEDLLPPEFSRQFATVSGSRDDEFDSVPLVSHTTAAQSPSITSQATIEVIRLPVGILEQLRPPPRHHPSRLAALSRRAHHCFPGSSHASRPRPARHRRARPALQFACTLPATPGPIFTQSIWATLSFRYVSFDADRFILRPHALDHPVELLNLELNESPSDSIVGRACICISEL
jgi:hypothetical protein